MQYIKLSRGATAIVCDCHYELVRKYKWHALKAGYAARKVWDGKTSISIYMHRLIMECPKGLEVDHINGVKADNRCENLRICTITNNRRNVSKHINNQSGYKGVQKTQWGWVAQIRSDGVTKHLGTYPSAIAAASSYNEAAIIYHGEYAKLNEL